MVVAASSALAACTPEPEEGTRSPCATRCSAWRRMVLTVQCAGLALGWLSEPGTAATLATIGRPLLVTRDGVLAGQHGPRRHGAGAVLEHVDRDVVEGRRHQLRARIVRRRLHGRDCRGARDENRLLDHAARLRADLPDLPDLQGLSRPDRRRAAARAADLGSPPGDDRSAGARDRRQGSEHADAHPPRADLRRAHGEGRRAVDRRKSSASRRRRCCTTSASWPCPSTSCRSPAR